MTTSDNAPQDAAGAGVRTDARVLQTEARHVFLLRLSDTLRSHDDPLVIEAAATRLLGEYLHVSRALYVEFSIEAGEEYVLVKEGYCAPGLTSLAGRIPAAQFGSAVSELHAGRTVKVFNAEADMPGNAERALWRDLGVGAYVALPLVKDGELVAAFWVQQTEPCVWTGDDVELIGETAERIWDAVARARIQATLRAIEHRLERQRRLYEGILTTTPDLAYVFDLDHRFIYANESLLKMWGKSRDEALGKTCLELGYPDWHAAMHDREIEQVVATRQPIRGVVPYTGTFGKRLYDYIFTPIINKLGEIEAVAGTTRDVTDLKRAEAALAASEARNRQILDSATDYAIVATDVEGKVRRWNTGAEQILGWSESEMLGQSIECIFTHEDLANGQLEREMQRARQRGRGTDERWHTRKGGARFWASGEMMPLLDDEDAVVGFVKVVRDRTEHRRAEQQRELLIHELNHRVKNTLAIVQSLAVQTFRGAGADQAVDTFESRLLALAHAHNILTSENWQGADVGKVVQEATAPWSKSERPHFDVHGPQLRVRTSVALALAMALHELLTNATKYGALSNDGGKISIRWSVTDGAAADFIFHWQERGGPPVREVARRGFGTRMIQDGLAGDLGGRVELTFDAAGVTCKLVAPLDKIRETSDSD